MNKQLIGIAVFVLLIFISGLFLGYYFGMKSRNFPQHEFRHIPDMRREINQVTSPGNIIHLQRKLKLSNEQVEKIKNILKKKKTDLENIKKSFRPEIKKVLKDIQDEIEKILTDKQRKLYRKYFKRKNKAPFNKHNRKRRDDKKK